MVNSQIVDRQITKYGEKVTIRIINEESFNDYGDVTVTSSEVSTYAVYNVYSQQNIWDLESGFKDGDKTFFFKSTEKNLKNGNIIIRADGSEYLIDDVKDPGLYGGKFVQEVRVNRS